jgi:hypothetical protein
VKISPSFETLAILTLVFSLASLPGLSFARADLTPTSFTTPLTQWWPAGPSADQIRYQFYSDTISESNALCVNQPSTCIPQIDLTDVPGPGVSSTDARFWVTPITPSNDRVEVDFNLASSFFGVTFCNGADLIAAGSTCNDGPGDSPITATCPGTIYKIGSAGDCSMAGTAIRQGIAHLIDKQAYVANVLQGQGFALDDPIAPAQSLPHSGLPAAPLHRTARRLFSRCGLEFPRQPSICV